MWDDELKPRERRFVLHYCTDETCLFNATQSYKIAFSTKFKEIEQSTAEVNASKLMKKDRIKKACRELLEITQEQVDEQAMYQVIHDLILLSLFNPAEIIDSNGQLKTSIDKLGEKAKCIQQIKQTKFGPEIVLADRSKYLGMLTNYLQLVKEDTKIDVSLPVVELPAKELIEYWNKQEQGEN